MKRSQHIISNFKQLILLFNAGAGEFHFLNTERKKQFNIKFTKTSIKNVSKVFVCFSVNNKFNYVHIGRYKFSNRIFYLLNDSTLLERYKDKLLEAFNYVLSSINTGNDFPEKILYYHSGHCCRCGKQLFDKKSLHKGLGADCEAFYKEEKSKIQLDLF